MQTAAGFFLRLFFGNSPLTIVIPTKRSAWRDLRTDLTTLCDECGKILRLAPLAREDIRGLYSIIPKGYRNFPLPTINCQLTL